MYFLVLLVILLIVYVLYKFSNNIKLPSKIHYSGMTHDDVDEIHSIEMGVYNTNDEVPSKFYKHHLISNCPELCMVARYENDEMIGAMYGGLIKGPSISNDKISMGHDSDGDTLFVYSECVRNDMRGHGIGSEISKYYYNEWVKYGDKIKYASTCVRRRHIGWMEKLGFSYVGFSATLVGNEPWFDVMKKIQQ